MKAVLPEIAILEGALKRATLMFPLTFPKFWPATVVTSTVSRSKYFEKIKD